MDQPAELRPAEPRLLGIGDNTVDTYVDAGLQFPGGNAVNVAVLAGRLGARAAYLGCFGGDEAGDLLRRALAAEGVDISRCRNFPEPNARAMIGHSNGDRRFLGSTPGVRARYALEDADFAYIGAHQLVHTSINSELDGELPRLRRAAPLLSYDFSEKWTPDLLSRLAPLIDVAFLSCPGRSAEECRAVLRMCAGFGARLAVTTRGADGAMALADGTISAQQVISAPLVDTLGAGDGFIAAFLLSVQSGASAPAALRRGADFAAKVCGWQGGFGHAAPWRPRELNEQVGQT